LANNKPILLHSLFYSEFSFHTYTYVIDKIKKKILYKFFNLLRRFEINGVNPYFAKFILKMYIYLR